jgi:cytochrome o ubiquinol oxidase operon protein cyoD
MSEDTGRQFEEFDEDVDTAPGDEFHGGTHLVAGLRTYVLGLALAVGLTVGSFWLAGTPLVWGPGVPVALIVFAVAQMGVHLVFFLHITTGPDNTNNVMALAFGVLIVVLVIGGSVWIMGHLSTNLMPMNVVMSMQR